MNFLFGRFAAPVTPSLSDYESAQPFVPPITSGYTIKVYDGDTITIVSKLPYDASPFYKFSVRLNGIDTPEIKGSTAMEKLKAQEAKNALSELILHKKVNLKNVSTEKYGRILADVYTEDGLHVNQWLLDQGHAVVYDGGKKTQWSDKE